MKINPYLMNQKAGTAYHTASSSTSLTTGSEASLKDESSKVLKEMGLSTTSSMQAAYGLYKNAGNEQPSKSVLTATQNFLEKAPGTEQQKLVTIEAAAAKGIEITEKNLTAVHSALNESASESLAINELTSDITVKKSAELTPEERRELVKTLPAALRERVYATLKAAGFSDAEVEEVGNRLLLGEKSEAIIPDLMTSRAKGELSDLLNQASSGDKRALNALNNLLEKTGLEIKLEKSVYSLGTAKGLSQETIEKIIQKVLKASASEKGENTLIRGLSELLRSFGGLELDGEGLADDSVLPDSKFADYGIKDKPQFAGLQNKDTNQAAGIKAGHSNQENQWDAKAMASEDGLSEDLELQGEEELEAAQDYLMQLAQMVDQSIEALSSAYGQVDLNSFSATTKTLLMTQVTEKMLAAKADFDRFKSHALEKIEQLMNTGRNQGLGEAVGKIADKLDKLIMHSDVTLYTDMKSERKLMGLSSELQEISTLSKTNPEAALEKLKEARKKIENLLYQPSKEKVIVTLKDEAALDLKLKEETVIPEGKISGGAKNVLDLMRTLGLNHEPELMDQVLSTGSKTIEESKENFKQILLKLTETDVEDQERLVKSVEKGLSQLTGQQLLNKPEPQNDSQSLFFNLPIHQGDQQMDMRLYVKARKKADQMDWENCSMYFLVDLKQYGETGIRINANQRQLSVSISNASSSIMDVVEPFAKEILQELKEIGYNPGDIKFVPIEDQNSIQELPKVKTLEAGKMTDQSGITQGRKGFEWQV